MPLNQKGKCKRDALETEVHAAYIQAKNIREQFRLFDNNLQSTIQRYEKWLSIRGETPKLNLEFYKSFK